MVIYTSFPVSHGNCYSIALSSQSSRFYKKKDYHRAHCFNKEANFYGHIECIKLNDGKLGQKDQNNLY